MTFLLVCIVVLLLIGVPIAYVMGTGSMFYLIQDGGMPLALIPQKMFNGVDSWLLMAIPLFMLAGQLMSKGGMSKRLIAFSSELLYFLKGSLGMICVLASMIFAGVSGSSVASTAAIGSIMLPAMKEKGYNMNFATALQAAAGAIGPIIPPSLMMILIGYLTGTSPVDLFLGGVLPGLLIGIGLMIVVYFHALKGGAYLPSYQSFSLKRVLKTGFQALPALGMPFIIIFGILGGIFTVTEAAVISVVYGFVIGIFVYKDIKLKDIPDIFVQAAELSAVILIIQSTTSVFSWLITVNDVPQVIAQFMIDNVFSQLGFYLLYAVLLIAVGMVMETFSASIMIIPLVFPVAQKFGINPVHFGVITTVGWAIGYITPPFGVTLFLSCSLTGKSIREVTPQILPITFSMLVVLLMIIFFPQLVLWLPELF